MDAAGLAGSRGAVALALLPADEPPTAAVGDVAELLDIDVQQITGGGVLVTPDGLAGGPVHLGQPADPAAPQHRVHGAGRHRQFGGDRDRPEPALPPHVNDPADQRLCGAGRAAPRTAAAISHVLLRDHDPGLVQLPEPHRPALRGRIGALEAGGGVGDGDLVQDHQSTQAQPCLRCQSSVSVHMDLLVGKRCGSS